MRISVEKLLVMIVFSLFLSDVWGQNLRPESLSIAYWGEMISHPGLKAEANYSLKSWEKEKQKKNIVLSPSLGVFYHKRYQTGVLPAVGLSYQSVRGAKKTFSGGLDLGYLRTFVPNTYQITEEGLMEGIVAGHNYLATNVYVSLGRNIIQDGMKPSTIYVKPQFMLALPNFPNAVGYFMLEIGLKYQLN
jgi:hypothetical protein